jgi:hypothetical protein
MKAVRNLVGKGLEKMIATHMEPKNTPSNKKENFRGKYFRYIILYENFSYNNNSYRDETHAFLFWPSSIIIAFITTLISKLVFVHYDYGSIGLNLSLPSPNSFLRSSNILTNENNIPSPACSNDGSLTKNEISLLPLIVNTQNFFIELALMLQEIYIFDNVSVDLYIVVCIL